MDRAAAAILGVAGAAVVAWVAVAVVDALPAIASDNPRQRDGGLFGLILIGIPVLVGGLLTLLVARSLWRDHRPARTLALVWVVAAGIVCWMSSGFGTLLWAAQILIRHPGALSLNWPYLSYNPFLGSSAPGGVPVVGTPADQLPSVRLDNLYFWLPGIIAVRALTVAGLLLAGWIARRAQRARSTQARNR